MQQINFLKKANDFYQSNNELEKCKILLKFEIIASNFSYRKLLEY